MIQKTQVKIQAVTMKNWSEGFMSGEARAAKKTWYEVTITRKAVEEA